MTLKNWLLGILLILAAPTVVLVAFAALTVGSNARPQSEGFRVAVEPQVVWPWQDTELRLTVDATGDGEALPAVDLALLIDVSGSMTESLPAMAEAVRAVAAAMPYGGTTRFALLRFDTDAEILVPWTEDPDALGRGLERLRAMTGQNDTTAAFARLGEVLASARPDVQRVVVWYSDGYLDACPRSLCADPMTYDEIATAAAAWRSRGVVMYAVAPPDAHSMPHDVLQRMTGPGRVLEPGRSADLAVSFERVAARVLGGERVVARLEQRLDDRYFRPRRSAHDWRSDGRSSLVLETDLFPGRSNTFGVTLEPRSMGWWSVGLEPALLARSGDPGSGPLEQRASRRPKLLVLSWWTLFWSVVPALLWAGIHRPRRPVVKEPVPVDLPPVGCPRAPGPLPPVPDSGLPSLRAVPTLFLGVGGRGTSALEAIRGGLDGLQGGVPGPYRFLAFDLDRRAPAPPQAACAQAPAERRLAPAAVTDLEACLRDPGREPSEWAWFDAARYVDTPREGLDLAGGARGDRPLGRLALFRWIADGEVMTSLRAALTDLMGRGPAPELRQVVVVASGQGGFGSGTFIDWGRLVRRLGRELQAASGVAMPEVIGLLADHPGGGRPENRECLDLEIQSAQAQGAHPLLTRYGSGPELERVDGEPPYQAILEIGGRDGTTADDQVAQAASLLVERRPRAALLDEYHAAGPGGDANSEAVQVRGRTLELFVALERERLRLELLGRLLGPDVLVDVGVEADGRVRLPELSEDDLDTRFSDWFRSELPSSPLALLIAGCSRRAADVNALVAAARGWPASVRGWLRGALEASSLRRLHGERSANGWRRSWMPGEATAVLRGLVRRLDQLEAEQPAVAEPARALRREAASAAEALEGWLREAGTAARRLAERREALEERRRRLESMDGRNLVPHVSGLDEQAMREIFTGWLGEPDSVSALREHLFPALTASAEGWGVEVRDHLARPAAYRAWADAERRLAGLATKLVESHPPSGLAQAIAALDPVARRDLASSIVARDERPDRTVLVLPAVEPDTHEALVLDELVEAIPQPAHHGSPRAEVRSADASSIRRLVLSRQTRRTSAARGAFAAAPEQFAELFRRRLEREYRSAFPTLPVPLRIALARPEAFASFAAAFTAGRIVRRRDSTGTEQWFSIDLRSPLTFGTGRGLAEAAAAYAARQAGHRVVAGAGPGSGGDFSRLERWRSASEPPDDEIVTLAAIRMAATSRAGGD